MINRPSYAQLTLERTRRSLQSLPTGLRPAVSGVLTVTEPAAADQPVERVEHAVELRRWRRKGTRHSRMTVR